MKTVLRRAAHLASAGLLTCAAGCTTLCCDPLSPPIVRDVSCTVKHCLQSGEEKMSPEYQEWIEELGHFWRDTKREFVYEYHRNNNWPQPYSTLAMQAAREPLATQAENARIQMASLWEYHFESGTGKLNTMGRRRLQDIVDQAGALGRVVYVGRSQNVPETELRVAEVHKELNQLTEEEQSFEVVEVRPNPSLVSGDEAQKAIKLLTAPPKSTSSSTSNSSSSGYTSGGQGGER